MKVSRDEWAVAVLAGLFLHCNDGQNPTLTTTTSVSVSGTADPDEGNTSGMTTNPTGGLTDDPTTEGELPVSPHAPCERYLDCVAATTPGDLPGAQMGYGADGTCWESSEEMAAQCRDACRTGLAQLHEAFPDASECTPCAVDGECDLAAGEACSDAGDCLPRCVDGLPRYLCTCSGDGDCDQWSKCADHACKPASCGDGIVQPGELCDGQRGCDPDCLGPFECTELSNAGCVEPEICNFDQCGPGYLDPELGQPCDGGQCQSGLYCAPNNKCVQLCALGGEPCPDDKTCIPTVYAPPFDYLGYCYFT